MKRTGQHLSRGMTLLELMVGSSLALFMTAAAFTFAQHQTKVLGVTAADMNMAQTGRAALDLLTDDLRHAGAGVGYRPDGNFPGLYFGTFTLSGVVFSSNNTPIRLGVPGTVVPTDDLGLRLADGNAATIADYAPSGSAQICAGSGVAAGDLAVFRTEDGLGARAVRLDSVGPATGCTHGVCLGGCQPVSWSPDSSYLSDPSVAAANFLGGELSGGLKSVVWFVEAADPTRPGVGAIRRAVFDGATTCAARDHRCGTLIAEGVETMQLQFWSWNPDTDRWENVSSAGPRAWSRLRVDVELVVRSMSAGERSFDRIDLRLEPAACLPSCITKDGVDRRVVRLSTEVKNAGRMRIR